MTSWQPYILALILTFPPTFVSYLAYRLNKDNKKAIQEVHLSINSRMDQLLSAAKGESKAEGLEQGRAESNQTL